MAQPTTLLMSLLTIVLSVSGVISTTFTFVNKCDYTVWPGILSNVDAPPLSTTGFTLQKGESKYITAPTSWSGRFWGRTLCSQDSTGYFSCVTGDCGSNQIECSGKAATPPATLAKFKHDGSSGLDFFYVSLVDGYNLPLLVVPQGGTGQNCTTTGCVADLNISCPTELKVMSADGADSVACKTACEAFNQPRYCCSGAYAAPDTCMPSMYSQMFKSACPYAASYAYDDKTNTFTCASADYTIIFCPTAPTPNTGQQSPPGQNGRTPTTTTRSPSITISSPVWLILLVVAVIIISVASQLLWPGSKKGRWSKLFEILKTVLDFILAILPSLAGVFMASTVSEKPAHPPPCEEPAHPPPCEEPSHPCPCPYPCSCPCPYPYPYPCSCPCQCPCPLTH